VNTANKRESGRALALFVLLLVCGSATHSDAAGFNASHAARASTSGVSRGIPHPLVLRWDPARLDSRVARRPSAGFAGVQSGLAIQELGDRFSVPPNPEGSVPFAIAWDKKSDIERAVRNFKQNGLPIVRLWGSGRSSLVLGVNPKRVPGIYFTQAIH
jgi:hypothetical protein